MTLSHIYHSIIFVCMHFMDNFGLEKGSHNFSSKPKSEIMSRKWKTRCIWKLAIQDKINHVNSMSSKKFTTLPKSPFVFGVIPEKKFTKLRRMIWQETNLWLYHLLLQAVDDTTRRVIASFHHMPTSGDTTVIRHIPWRYHSTRLILSVLWLMLWEIRCNKLTYIISVNIF